MYYIKKHGNTTAPLDPEQAVIQNALNDIDFVDNNEIDFDSDDKYDGIFDNNKSLYDQDDKDYWMNCQQWRDAQQHKKRRKRPKKGFESIK